MRLVFAGTPHFALVILQHLVEAGHDIVTVLTQPDRPSGRGMQQQASPVKQYAQQHEIPVWQPTGLKLDGRYADEAQACQAHLQTVQADAMIVAAYGLLLPAWVLAWYPLGCLNVHASLLPRWRGAAPILRAIEAGDTETGVCIMQMAQGLDTGDVLCQTTTPILPNDNAETLHDRLAQLGAETLTQWLTTPTPWQGTPQNEALANYAAKWHKQEATIDWSVPAWVIANKIRAFNPTPSLTVTLRHQGGMTQEVKIGGAILAKEGGGVGGGGGVGTIVTITKEALWVQCGEGLLGITTLQRIGGKRMPVADWCRGYTVMVGDQFSSFNR